MVGRPTPPFLSDSCSTSPAWDTNLTDYWYDLEGLDNGTLYFWYVEANDNYSSSYSEIWNFTTAYDGGGNYPPDMPWNPYPANGSDYVDVNTTVSWDASDPDGDDLTYFVYWGEDPEVEPPEVSGYPPQPVDLNETWYYPGTMNYNMTYYWAIGVYDGINLTYGPLWNFTTEPEQGPPSEGWNVSISVEVGGSTTLNATFGMRDGANSSFNSGIGDKVLPPGFAGIESYFYYPDESSSPIDYRKLSVSYLNETYPANWTFYVHTFSGVSGDAEIHWNASYIYDIPNNYYVILNTTSGIVNMRSIDYYEWTATENTYYEFTIMVYEPV